MINKNGGRSLESGLSRSRNTKNNSAYLVPDREKVAPRSYAVFLWTAAASVDRKSDNRAPRRVKSRRKWASPRADVKYVRRLLLLDVGCNGDGAECVCEAPCDWGGPGNARALAGVDRYLQERTGHGDERQRSSHAWTLLRQIRGSADLMP